MRRASQVVPGEMAAQGDVVQFALLVALLVGLKRGLLLFAQSFERAHCTIGRDQCLALGIDLPGKLDALLLALCSLGSQRRRVTLEFEAPRDMRDGGSFGRFPGQDPQLGVDRGHAMLEALVARDQLGQRAPAGIALCQAQSQERFQSEGEFRHAGFVSQTIRW